MNRKLTAQQLLHEQGIRFAMAAVVLLLVNFSFGPAYAQVATADATTKAASAAAISEVAMVRHAPVIVGKVSGSIRQLLPENASLGGSAIVTGDLLVPGSPVVRIVGSPTYSGTLDVGGAISPFNHMITLGGRSQLRHVMRCVEPMPMASITAPTPPRGTESVVLSQPNDCIRHWESILDLTLTGQASSCAVPPGSYGSFRADQGTCFVLGVEGSTVPTHYSFESLALSGQTALQVVGPVVVTLQSGLTLTGSVGNAANASWLKLQICQGDLTLNAGSTLNAIVIAPRSTVFVNMNAILVGYAEADRLWVGSGGLISGIPEAEGQSDIFGYQSMWRYKVYADSDDVPEGWEENDFKAAGFRSGRGAFASSGTCDVQAMRQTDWPTNAVIVIRKNFRLPAGVTSVRISGTVTGDVQIFLNGRLITDWVSHEGCGQPDDLSFTAPENSFWQGANTLAIRARGTGDQNYLDYRVSINE